MTPTTQQKYKNLEAVAEWVESILKDKFNLSIDSGKKVSNTHFFFTNTTTGIKYFIRYANHFQAKGNYWRAGNSVELIERNSLEELNDIDHVIVAKPNVMYWTRVEQIRKKGKRNGNYIFFPVYVLQRFDK